MIVYLLMLGFALFAIGISAAALSRSFIAIIFAIEVMLVAASLVGISMFSIEGTGNVLLLLFTIWSIAAIDVIVFVVLYRYIAKFEPSLEVNKLSKYRD